MKKIIRGILLGFLCVIVVTVAAVTVYLTQGGKHTEIVRPTVTDANGNAYIAAVGEAGETYAVVTDAEGNRWAAEYDENGDIGNTVANVNDKFSAEDIPKNYDGPTIDETVGANDYTGAVNSGETVPSTTASQKDPTASTSQQQTSTTQAPQGEAYTYRIEKYQKIFASNTYLMEFTTNDPDLGDTPITAAAKGGNILIDTRIEGISCKMLYLADKDTTYLLLDNYRKYAKLPESLMGDDFDISDMNVMSNFASDIKADDITVSTVTLNGKQIICESYTAKNGNEMRYYFDDDVLVRMDSTDKDGNVTSTYISRITSEVPDSTFEIPKNYGYINLSWLGLIAGN